MAETLTKLEREVLGKQIRSPLSKRRAVVRIAPPLDVRDFLSTQGGAPFVEGTIEAIVVRLHDTLQATLNTISRDEGNR
jgi:hypothetical protein